MIFRPNYCLFTSSISHKNTILLYMLLIEVEHFDFLTVIPSIFNQLQAYQRGFSKLDVISTYLTHKTKQNTLVFRFGRVILYVLLCTKS